MEDEWLIDLFRTQVE